MEKLLCIYAFTYKIMDFMRVNTHTSTHTNTQTNKKTFKTWNHFQKQIKKCIECLRWLVVSILFLTLIKLTWLKFCEKPLNFWTFFAKIKCLNCFFSWNMHGRNCACESVVLFLKVWLENIEKSYETEKSDALRNLVTNNHW